MKKGILPLGIGIFLVITAIVAPIPVFISLLSQDKHETVFMIPATLEAQVNEPGKYYLWHNHHTVFEGEVYANNEELPHGLKISISDGSGSELPFIADASTSSSSGSSAKQSIGYVEIAHPQQLKISISNTAENRIFSFSKSNFKEFFTKLMAFFAFGVGGFFGGAALILIGILKLNKAKRTPSPLPQTN